MEHKKAIVVLMNILKKYPLDAKEKEAVLNSIGLLDWAARAKNRIKILKAKKDKSVE